MKGFAKRLVCHGDNPRGWALEDGCKYNRQWMDPVAQETVVDRGHQRTKDILRMRQES